LSTRDARGEWTNAAHSSAAPTTNPIQIGGAVSGLLSPSLWPAAVKAMM